MSDPTNVKLSFREKAGYSLGDAGANFVFQMMIIFQTAFYTDVMGISAVTVGWMLLLVRFSDAITDPIMGAIADRTETRWGKFRPWLIWSAIPFALLFWAAYTVPAGLSDSAKLWYAVGTYTVLMMAYTMNNAPYSALNGVMTSNGSERTSVSQYRFFAAMVAAFIVQGLTLPLVKKLGEGDDAKGWSLTVGIFAVIMVGLFVITFFSAKERVKPPVGQKSDLKQDFRDIMKNPPWIAMFIMTTFVFITLALRGGSTYYYFTYFVDADALTGFVDKMGFFANPAALADPSLGFKALDLFGLIVKPGDSPTAVGFSMFNMAGGLVNIIGVLAAKPLADRFGKKLVFTVGLGGAAIVQSLFFWLGAESVGTMFMLTIITSMLYGPTIPLLWAMIADCADFGEWKTHRRSTGFVFAGIVFALKGGLGIGGAFTGWLLAMYGYPDDAKIEPEWKQTVIANYVIDESADVAALTASDEMKEQLNSADFAALRNSATVALLNEATDLDMVFDQDETRAFFDLPAIAALLRTNEAKAVLDEMKMEARSQPNILLGFRQMIGLISGGFFGLGALTMVFYPISKKVAIQMEDELAARRSAAS